MLKLVIHSRKPIMVSSCLPVMAAENCAGYGVLGLQHAISVRTVSSWQQHLAPWLLPEQVVRLVNASQAHGLVKLACSSFFW